MLPLRPSAPTPEPSRVETKLVRSHRRPARERVEGGELGCRDAAAGRRRRGGGRGGRACERVCQPRPGAGAGRLAPPRPRGLQGCGDGQGIEGQGRDEETPRAAAQEQGRRQPEGWWRKAGRRRGPKVTPDRKLSGKAAEKAREKRAKAAKARKDKAVEPVTWTDALRVGPGLRARRRRPALDARLHRRQGRGQGASWRAAGPSSADLQERLFAESKGGGQRSVLLVIQGMDTSGKGGIMRHVVGRSTRRACTSPRSRRRRRGGAGARLPLAHPQGAAPARA